jgi:hypothetical protein
MESLMDLFGMCLLHVLCLLGSRAQQQGVVAMAIVRKIVPSWRGRVSRLGFAVCRSLVLAGLLLQFGSAVADPTAQGPAAPGVRSFPANSACPSTEFAGFLQAFSQSPVLQRRYTHFPLEFGLEDLSHLNDADEGFKTSTIHSFEKMPNYNRESGTVFPTPTRIEKFGLKTEITTIKNSKTAKDKNVFPEEIISDPAVVTVLVTLPDSGVLVFYRFRKMQGCWFLYAVSDRST